MEYNETLENFFQGMQTGDLVEDFKNGAVEIPVNKVMQCIYVEYGDDDKVYCCNEARHFSRYCDFANTKEKCEYAKFDNQQTAKADSGKIEMAYVPPAIIEAVGKVRTFGNVKYGDPNNWREVEPMRYKHALMRHLVEWLKDEDTKDSDSNLYHLEHIACNVAFLLEFLYEKNKEVQND